MSIKRMTVQAFLDDPDKAQWQDHLIADACHCSTRLVKDMRQERLNNSTLTHAKPKPKPSAPPGNHSHPIIQLTQGAPETTITLTTAAFIALLHSLDAHNISAGNLARKLESSGIPLIDCYRIIRDLYSESGT